MHEADSYLMHRLLLLRPEVPTGVKALRAIDTVAWCTALSVALAYGHAKPPAVLAQEQSAGQVPTASMSAMKLDRIAASN